MAGIKKRTDRDYEGNVVRRAAEFGSVNEDESNEHGPTARKRKFAPPNGDRQDMPWQFMNDKAQKNLNTKYNTRLPVMRSVPALLFKPAPFLTTNNEPHAYSIGFMATYTCQITVDPARTRWNWMDCLRRDYGTAPGTVTNDAYYFQENRYPGGNAHMHTEARGHQMFAMG